MVSKFQTFLDIFTPKHWGRFSPNLTFMSFFRWGWNQSPTRYSRHSVFRWIWVTSPTHQWWVLFSRDIFCFPLGIVRHTVDGWNPANQLRLVVFPIIYRVSYIPGGAGFQPSTVVSESERIGVSFITFNETHRSFRFHETILSFGELIGSLGFLCPPEKMAEHFIRNCCFFCEFWTEFQGWPIRAMKNAATLFG